MLYYDNIMPPHRKILFKNTRAGLRSLLPGTSLRMDDKQLAQWQAQLESTRAELARLGPMRPGSLSQQYKDPAAKTGAYWQLSYTHNMRSRSRYVRPDELAQLKPLLANFKRFRLLVDRWVDLSVNIADRQTELHRSSQAKSA
jgi:hypothetical protein